MMITRTTTAIRANKRRGLITRCANRLYRWLVIRRDITHVRTLPAYLLDDIGLKRDEIEGKVERGRQ